MDVEISLKRWPPRSLIPWYSCPWCIPIPHWIGLTCITRRYYGYGDVLLPGGDHKMYWDFCLALSRQSHSVWWKSVTVSWGHSSKATERSVRWGIEAPFILSAMSHTGTGSSSPSQTFGCLRPHLDYNLLKNTCLAKLPSNSWDTEIV